PSYMFTDKEHRGPFEFSEDIGALATEASPADITLPSQRVEASDNDLLLTASEKEENRGTATNGSVAYSAPDYNGSSTTLVSHYLYPTSNTAASQSDVAGSSAAPPASISQPSLEIDDLLGLGPVMTTTPTPALKLNSKAVLDPATFQRKWGQLPIALTQVGSFKLLLKGTSSGMQPLFDVVTCRFEYLEILPQTANCLPHCLRILFTVLLPLQSELLSNFNCVCLKHLLDWTESSVILSNHDYTLTAQGVASLTSPQVLLRHMQGHSIQCIASGGQPPNFKFFFFAQKSQAPSGAGFFLVECLVNTSSSKAHVKVKTDDTSLLQDFAVLFQSALLKFGAS
ncbi:hypothetical protein KI387_012213, partial [Taxus chinensis]